MSNQQDKVAALTESLRAARVARGGRSTRIAPRQEPPRPHQDAVVQETDTDAAGSRLSAMDLGYIDDEFVRAFASSKTAGVRRQPIINRGTYVRTTALDRLVEEFLDRHWDAPTLQIVSLGAGTDTRFFRMAARPKGMPPGLQYHEIDFPTTTSRKIKSIEGSSTLQNLLGASSSEKSTTPITSLHAPQYHVHGLDLRHLTSPTPPTLPHLTAAPTLLLSECCLTYLPARTSTALLTHFSTLTTPHYLSVLLYEPLHPHDPFGRTMISNLAARNLELPGLTAFPDITAHRRRLRESGFSGGDEGWTVREMWEGWVGAEEKERLRGCEMVDEEEEWVLLAGHYGIVRGWRDGGGG